MPVMCSVLLCKGKSKWCTAIKLERKIKNDYEGGEGRDK